MVGGALLLLVLGGLQGSTAAATSLRVHAATPTAAPSRAPVRELLLLR